MSGVRSRERLDTTATADLYGVRQIVRSDVLDDGGPAFDHGVDEILTSWWMGLPRALRRGKFSSRGNSRLEITLELDSDADLGRFQFVEPSDLFDGVSAVVETSYGRGLDPCPGHDGSAKGDARVDDDRSGRVRQWPMPAEMTPPLSAR